MILKMNDIIDTLHKQLRTKADDCAQFEWEWNIEPCNNTKKSIVNICEWRVWVSFCISFTLEIRINITHWHIFLKKSKKTKSKCLCCLIGSRETKCKNGIDDEVGSKMISKTIVKIQFDHHFCHREHNRVNRGRRRNKKYAKECLTSKTLCYECLKRDDCYECKWNESIECRRIYVSCFDVSDECWSIVSNVHLVWLSSYCGTCEIHTQNSTMWLEW